MITLGIDPGLAGALAFYDQGAVLRIYDMPVLALGKGEIDAHKLAAWLRLEHCEHAFIEDVHSMPEQGVASSFAFGKSFGVLIGVMAAVGVSYTPVSPQKWKAALQVPKIPGRDAKARSAAKEAARARASQLMPMSAGLWPLKKHADRAEAALLALYGARQLSGFGSAA